MLESICQNIAEPKQAEAALRQSHGELRAIYDGMIDGMVVVDLESLRILRANRSFFQITGYEEDEIFTRTLFDFHPACGRAQFQALIDKHLLDEAGFVADMPLVRKSGEAIYADISMRRIVYHEKPAMLAFVRDVTERKLAEESLRRDHETLERMLESSDHDRQLIAYEIHDGLAQQLAGAIMHLESYRCQRSIDPRLAEKSCDLALKLMQEAHFEARRLINDVRPPILDEEGIVPALTHLAAEAQGQQGLRVEFTSRVRFARLPASLEDAIYRIVQESLNNARKHSQAQRVRVELTQSDRRVRIRIQDNGVGFAPQDVDRNRFGLQGMQQRARLLEGIFDLQTKEGKGTRISVEFPLRIGG